MNREKGKAQGEKGEGIVQLEEVSNIKRVLGLLQWCLNASGSKDCKCVDITNQLKSVSSITRKVAFHILERHISDCLKEKDYKKLALANKAMDKLSKECAKLGILSDKEEQILWEKLEKAEYRVDKPTDAQ